MLETRKPDRRTADVDMRLELLVRGREARKYHVQARDGFRRVVRLIEAGFPVEAHSLASAGVVAMDKAIAKWPEDAA
jgi:hypothetical protein